MLKCKEHPHLSTTAEDIADKRMNMWKSVIGHLKQGWNIAILHEVSKILAFPECIACTDLAYEEQHVDVIERRPAWGEARRAALSNIGQRHDVLVCPAAAPPTTN
ncbi:hypothetical protein Daus18300_013110 [Diaporthe australafricana]|uniref:Uncharacterized protein n=1 Tax=Diaporthe australafricana TaxID=127596 RepID=A0ABR3W0H3_9PEZI